MSDMNQIATILNYLSTLWFQKPDLRLGQLVYGAAKNGGWKGEDIYNVKDEEILAGLVQLAEGDVVCEK